MEHHDHSHSHSHSIKAENLTTAFYIGITLNFMFVIIQVIVGLNIHSLSLLSDAGHNLADVGALALSLLAFRLAKIKSNNQFTYGYRKTTILVALFNAMVLLASVGAIFYEAIHHFLYPEPTKGITISIVAAIGIIINTSTALLFFKEKDKDMNIKSAYLHLMSDAVISLGLVIGGILIYYTNWFWIDSTLSVIIAVTILLSTWSLLKESLRLSLDGVPKGINIEYIKKEALALPEIKDIYHIHIWAISTTENAFTAQITLMDSISSEQEITVKNKLKHILEHHNIQHITLETNRA